MAPSHQDHDKCKSIKCIKLVGRNRSSLVFKKILIQFNRIQKIQKNINYLNNLIEVLIATTEVKYNIQINKSSIVMK